jgi:hypothetical protein
MISIEINLHMTPAGAVLKRFFLLLVGGGGRTGYEFKSPANSRPKLCSETIDPSTDSG